MGMIIFCLTSAASAAQLTCTVEEVNGSFGSFSPPLVGNIVKIDTSNDLDSLLFFSDGTGFRRYIPIGTEVRSYTSSRIKVGYEIVVREDGPEAPEEELDFRVILDKENILTINKVGFSNQAMRYFTEHLKATCE